MSLFVKDVRMQAGDKAPDVTLVDSTNRPIELASLWQEQPLALFFSRHKG